MSASAKRQKGWVLPSNLPEHGFREPMSGSDAELGRAKIAANANAVSASIAVYRLQAKYLDGQSDGKICALRHEVIVFRMLIRAGDN